MAIAWRNGTSAVTPGAATSVVISVPSGVANGDLLLLLLNTDAGGSTHSTPSGWTAVPVSGLNWNPGALGAKVASLWWRIAASEPASYTLTWTGSNEGAAVMGAWSGTDATTPLGGVNDVLTVGSSQASPATLTASAVSSLVGNSQIVVVGLVDQSNNTPQATWTTSSGMTVRVQVSSGAVNFCGGMMADVAQASTGTSGTKAFTATAAGETYIPFAYTLVLAPPAAPLPPDEDFPGPLPRPVAWYPPPVQALLDESELVVNGPSFLVNSTGTVDGDEVNGETVNGEYSTAAPLPCDEIHPAAWMFPPPAGNFASAMLFAALAACGHGQTHDDDFVFTAPPVVVDEDAYQAPRPQTQPPPLWLEYVLGNEDDIPAGNLRGALDEDFWVPPFPATVVGGGAGQQPAPRIYLPDADEVDLPLAAQDDGPGWVIPVLLGNPPLPPPLVLRNVEDDIPAGSLSGAPDLDEVWRNPVPPVAGANRVPPPLWEAAEDPAGFLAGQPDEDFWVSGVPPVPGQNRVSLPLGDPEAELPAATLYGVPEERDSAPARPWASSSTLPLVLVDDDLPVSATVDEDGWVSGVQPTTPSNRVSLPWEPEADELSATLAGQPDEDFPGPLPAPVQGRNLVVLPLVDVEEIPAASLYGAPDVDDVWPEGLRPPAPAVGVNRVSLPWEPELDELPTTLSGQPDEDFWVSGVPPTPASNRVALPLGDPESEQPALYGVTEEDRFSPPAPWPLTTARPFADTDEVPTQPLGYQPDEDFWVSGVAPVPGASRVALPIGDQDSEVPSLFGVPEEDSSAPRPVPVVASNRVSLPWEPELDELPTTLSGQPDEDFWVNPVRPIVGSNRVSLPWEPELDELPTTLSGQPDEDFWISGVPPVPGSSRVSLPLGDADSEVPALYGVPEEDAYRAPVFAQSAPRQLAPDDDFPPQTLPPDEDFWHVPVGVSPPLPPLVFLDGSASEWVPFIATQIAEDEPYFAPVARPSGNFAAPVYPWGTDEDVPRLYGVPEEDSTAPLPTQTRFPPLPVRAVAETDEPPAGNLSGTPDADEQWQNWVAPVQASNRVPPPLWELAEDPAGSLSGMPDEDFPGPLPRPVPPSSLVLLPIGDRDSETPLLRGAPEEDQYRAPVLPWPPLPPRVFTDTDERPSFLVEDEPYFAPVARPDGTFRALPVSWDENQDVPRLYGVPEEDRYSAPILPLPPIVRASTADDEPLPYVIDEDFFRPPPPWVDKLVRPFSEGDEWPTTVTVDEDVYSSPWPWPIPPPIRPARDSDEWVPFISVSIGTDEDFYFPPRQSIPLPPLRAFQGVEDETRLIAPNNSFVRYMRQWAIRLDPEREPPHPVAPTPYPRRDDREAPQGIPFDEDDDGWVG